MPGRSIAGTSLYIQDNNNPNPTTSPLSEYTRPSAYTKDHAAMQALLDMAAEV